jgi:nucleoside-diphosphate-sugar epimerase
MKKILVTGAFGQIGSELVPALTQKFGEENIIAMGHKTLDSGFKGVVETGDIREKEVLSEIIKKYDIGTVYHLVSLLSVKGEVDPAVTWDINMNGLKNVLDLSIEHKLKVFWPSSIAAFGPTTPKDNTPQHTVLEPTTMYGVTKAAGEGLCRYYNKKYGLDVRSIRYPGIISWKTHPGGGTTDYAVAIFHEGLKNGKYEFFVGPETTLPMMFIDDAIRATLELMEADLSKVEFWNSYNLTAISFQAQELAAEVKKHIPELSVSYRPDARQKIADSWPNSIDDLAARDDWGWNHEYDLAKMTDVMVKNLKKHLSL